MFEHPISGEALLDVSLSGENLSNSTVAELWLTSVLLDYRLSEPTQTPLSSDELAALAATLQFFFPKRKTRADKLHPSQPTTDKARSVARFLFEWDHFVFISLVPHGYSRQKRARSLKKRHTKRLVRRTQFRF